LESIGRFGLAFIPLPATAWSIIHYLSLSLSLLFPFLSCTLAALAVSRFFPESEEHSWMAETCLIQGGFGPVPPPPHLIKASRIACIEARQNMKIKKIAAKQAGAKQRTQKGEHATHTILAAIAEKTRAGENKGEVKQLLIVDLCMGVGDWFLGYLRVHASKQVPEGMSLQYIGVDPREHFTGLAKATVSNRNNQQTTTTTKSKRLSVLSHTDPCTSGCFIIPGARYGVRHGRVCSKAH
jgi:hypothetical protein